MAKRRKLRRAECIVTVWEERDRLHIGITDAATEQRDVADWWDDDARQMFEVGFFERGWPGNLDGGDPRLVRTVLDYAESLGLIAA